MLTAIFINTIVCLLAVAIHYEFLFQASGFLHKMPGKHRFRMLIGVFVALLAHIIEIWLFAVAFYFMHHADDYGSLNGNFDGSLLDSVYFSFISYTTLGIGDIEPVGQLRFLVGIEALVGLVLIAWSASFFYDTMRRYWR